MKLYIVATTTEVNEDDLISDIILITDSKPKATRIFNKVSKHKPVKGLDYHMLADYDGVTWFTRELNTTVHHENEGAAYFS
jgi:hypothetical protein